MDTVILLILATAAAAMVVIHLVVAFAAIWSRNSERVPGSIDAGPGVPRVSVLVPARNEEELLPRLLGCLEAQDTDDFEVVLVNDRSDDRTAEIMAEYASRHPDRVQVLTLTTPPPPGNPKQRALAEGARVATGDVILMTDADCWVAPDWVRTMTFAFRTADVGIVFGPVVPGVRGLERRPRLFDRYQGFDQVFRFQYTAGAAGLGRASGGFGNNLAVRRAALEDVGGFEGLAYSMTEDAQLICQVRDTGRWAIHAVRAAGARVVPATQERFRDLVRQSIRWNDGGLFAPDATTRFSYGLVIIFLFVSVLALPIALVYPPVGLLALSSFVSMTLLGIVAGVLNHPGLWYWPLLVPNVVFSMLFYSYVTILSLLRVKVTWKGLVLPPQ